MADEYRAVVESGVSADKVSTKILIYENDTPPATHVSATKDKDGTYTITAYYLIGPQPTPAPGPGPAPAPGPGPAPAPGPGPAPAPGPGPAPAPGPGPAPALGPGPAPALGPGPGPAPGPGAAGALNGVVSPARPGIQGFDCDSPLTAAQVAGLKAFGFGFCLRYISLGSSVSAGDLTRAEAERILTGGLALMPVQHVNGLAKYDQWIPSEDEGLEYGTNAVNHLKSIGFPSGINVWLDIEGIAPGTPAQIVIDYCNTWISQVAGAGFVPGIYVGANAILSGDELYFDIKASHYWKSGSNVPNITNRGYQMTQRIAGEKVVGVGIDRDVTFTDAFGGTVIWLSRSSAGNV